MKIVFYLITTAILLFNCNQSNKSSGSINDQSISAPIKEEMNNQAGDSIQLQNLFTVIEAEKILGEPAHLSDSAVTVKDNVWIYSCAFMANAKDLKSDKTGNVYFLIEQYAQDSSAQRVYSFIKTANENHGIRVLDDIGDEAYFHTDNQNFYFILARKGVKMFRMKVNKITSTTSLDAFNQIAKDIVSDL